MKIRIECEGNLTRFWIDDEEVTIKLDSIKFAAGMSQRPSLRAELFVSDGEFKVFDEHGPRIEVVEPWEPWSQTGC